MEEEVYSHYSGSRSPSPSESGTQYARRACNSTTWIHEEVQDMGTKLDKHIAYFNESMESIVPALEFLAVEARMNKMQNIAAGHKELATECNLNERLDAIETRLSDWQSLSLAQTLKAINALKQLAKVYSDQGTQTEAATLGNQCLKLPQIFSFCGSPRQALKDERLEGGVGDRGPGPRNQDRDDSPEPKDLSEAGDTSVEDIKEVELAKWQVQKRDDEQSSAKEIRPIFLLGVGEKDKVPQEDPSEAGDTSEEDIKDVEPAKQQVQKRDDEQSSAKEIRPIFLPGVGEKDKVPQEDPSEAGDTPEDIKEVEPAKLLVPKRDDEQSSAMEIRPIFCRG
jgi:hypothetical protein